MSDRFYKFQHECDSMPDNIYFCQLDGCNSSQFTFEQHERRVGHSSTTLYGFRYCPYCGEDMMGGESC